MILGRKMITSSLNLKTHFLEYRYIIYLAIASFFVISKIYLYSFFVSEEDFSQINLFIMSVGLLSVLLTLGLNLRCHSVLPSLYKDKSIHFIREIDAVKTTIFISASILFVSVISINLIFALSVVQGALYSFFFIDQIAIKSRFKMTQYALNNCVRNFLILVFGLLGGLLFENSISIIWFEILGCFILSVFSRNISFKFYRGFFSHVKRNFSFLLVTLSGLVVLYLERVVAYTVLDEKDFALFSYFYILVVAAMTAQQFINTRFIAEVSVNKNILSSFEQARNRSILMFLVCICLLVILIIPLSYNDLYFSDVDIYLLAFFIVLGALKGTDFFQTVFVVFNQRLKIFFLQALYLVLMVLGYVYFRTNGVDLFYLLVFYILSYVVYLSGSIFLLRRSCEIS
jgi:hypothetical protein